MKLPFAYYGNPILRKKCLRVESITEEIKIFINQMVESLVEKNGWGLSAPQVSSDLRIFITAVPEELPDGKWKPAKLRVFINPEILSVNEKTWITQEGCLSIPKLYAEVERPISVVVKATDLEGNVFEEEFTGWEGRCVLHENDHLNGVLFVDRIKGKEREELEPLLKKIKKRFHKG